jgi:hypothetical protein
MRMFIRSVLYRFMGYSRHVAAPVPLAMPDDSDLS